MNNIEKVIFCCLIIFANISVGAVEDQNIDFYGIVLDQFQNPVENARVEVQILQEIEGSKNYLDANDITDQDGKFSFHFPGEALFLTGISKPGFDFKISANPERAFYYKDVYEKHVFKPDSNQPVRFTLKNLDEPAFLINRAQLTRNFYPDDTRSFGLNLLGTWIDEKGKIHEPTSAYRDLKVYTRKSPDNLFYELWFVEMDTNSGVIAKNKKLEKAPEVGYVSEAKLKIPIHPFSRKEKRYIYVKGRGGTIYSRLDLELFARQSGLFVRLDVWTNPQGSRNLKYDQEFQAYEEMRRYDARETAYLEKLEDMTNPSLAKRLQSAKDANEKGGSEQFNSKGMYFYDPYEQK